MGAQNTAATEASWFGRQLCSRPAGKLKLGAIRCLKREHLVQPQRLRSVKALQGSIYKRPLLKAPLFSLRPAGHSPARTCSYQQLGPFANLAAKLLGERPIYMLYRVMRAPVQFMPTAVLNGLAAATMGSPLLQCTTSTGALLNLF